MCTETLQLYAHLWQDWCFALNMVLFLAHLSQHSSSLVQK